MTLLHSSKLQQLAEDTLKYARNKGASDCVIQIDGSRGLNVQVRQNEVEQIQFHEQSGVAISVYIGKKKGSSGLNQLSLTQLHTAVDKAYVQASFAEEDKYAGVAEEAILAKERRNLGLYHPLEVDREQAVAMALQAEQAAFATDARIVNSEGGAFDSDESIQCLATSRGFNEIDRETDYSLSCAVMAKDGESQQVDYWHDRSRVFADLAKPEDIGAKAAYKALQKLGSKPIATGKYPVLLVPEIAKGYWSSFLGAIRGAAVYKKSTFLLEKMNEQIFPQWLSVEEQPHLIGGYGSGDYDAEGVATRQKHIIQDGRLLTWLLGCYSARKLGLASTGNAGSSGNIVLDAPTKSLEQLYAELGTGLIVTDTMGHGLNMVTGDFSVGVQGLWVENGKIQHAVEEITMASNCLDMYKCLVGVGSDIDTRGSIRCGSVLLESMMIGGNS